MRKVILIGLATLALVLAIPTVVLGSSILPTGGGETASVAFSHDTPETRTPRPWIGVTLANLNPRLAEGLGLSQETGVVVLYVIKDSPADAAQLQSGDIIVSVGETTVETVKDVAMAVRAANPGDALNIAVLRSAGEEGLQVTVGEHPWQTIPKPQLWPRFLPLIAHAGEGVHQVEITVEDPDGNPVALSFIRGTINAVGASSVTVTPKDGSATLDLTAGEGVHIIKGGQKASLSELAVNEEVIVVLSDGALEALVAAPFPTRHSARISPHGSGLVSPPRITLDLEGAIGPSLRFSDGNERLSGLRERLTQGLRQHRESLESFLDRDLSGQLFLERPFRDPGADGPPGSYRLHQGDPSPSPEGISGDGLTTQA